MLMAPSAARSWLPTRPSEARAAIAEQQRLGRGPVADDVAEAPHLVGMLGIDRCEHGLEGVIVRVDV